MKRKAERPNRMLKEEDTVKRVAEEAPEPAPETEPEAWYPCKFCQGRTDVTRSFPSFETVQEPVKIVKRRYRKCRVCGRSFSSQEETIKAR